MEWFIETVGRTYFSETMIEPLLITEIVKRNNSKTSECKKKIKRLCRIPCSNAVSDKIRFAFVDVLGTLLDVIQASDVLTDKNTRMCIHIANLQRELDQSNASLNDVNTRFRKHIANLQRELDQSNASLNDVQSDDTNAKLHRQITELQRELNAKIQPAVRLDNTIQLEIVPVFE